jgi:hypothetical protein
MRLGETCLYLFCFLAVIGCTQAARARPHEAQDDFRPTVEREVSSVIRNYMAGYDAARCDDVTPVSKLVRDSMIYVTKSEIIAVPLAATERELRDTVCGRVSHTGIVDSIVVDALSRDIAVAAWLYHDEVKLKSGETKRSRGSALMTLIRSADGWKITSTMAAYD